MELKICKQCKRGLPATNKYFFNDSKKKDGLFLKCKECEGYKFQDIKSRYVVEDGYKVCRKCEKVLPLNSDFFMRNSSTKDNFDNDCKVCNGYKYTFYNCREGYRVCIKCKEEKELNYSNFHKDSSARDGFDTICKECKFGRNIDNFSIRNWYEERSNKFKNRWNFNDIKWMYENYITIEKQDLLNYFDNKIGYKTLMNIIYQWNVKKKDKNDNWSNDEMEFINRNYTNMPQNEIEAYFPNRTWQSIKVKASKLNIHRDSETLSKINSESHIGIKISDEARKKMSLSRRGSNNYSWKGGISPIIVRLREYTIPWKLDSLKEYNYVCGLSGINDRTLEIHHLNKNFSEIVYETFELLYLPLYDDMSKYSQVERDLIRDILLELHYYYGLGIPLTKILHKKFHSIYGNRNNTPEQFDEYKDNYINNKYEMEVVN